MIATSGAAFPPKAPLHLLVIAATYRRRLLYHLSYGRREL
jgi:hypothetical protein